MPAKILLDPEPRILEDIFYPQRLAQLKRNFELIEVDTADRDAFYNHHIRDADFIIGQPTFE